MTAALWAPTAATAGEVDHDQTLYPVGDLVRTHVEAGEAVCFEDSRRVPTWSPRPEPGTGLESEVDLASAQGDTRYKIVDGPTCRLVQADGPLLLDTMVTIKGGKQAFEEAVEEWDHALEAAVGLPAMVVSHPVGWPVDVPSGTMTARAALEAMVADVGVALVWEVVWVDASFFPNGPPDEQGRWIISMVSPRGAEREMPAFGFPNLKGNEPGMRALPGGRVESFRTDPVTGAEVILEVEQVPPRSR